MISAQMRERNDIPELPTVGSGHDPRLVVFVITPHPNLADELRRVVAFAEVVWLPSIADAMRAVADRQANTIVAGTVIDGSWREVRRNFRRARVLALLQDGEVAHDAIAEGVFDYAEPTVGDSALLTRLVHAVTRCATERTLSRSRDFDRYYTLIASALDAILIADRNSGIFVDANDAACVLFGYSYTAFLTMNGRTLFASGQDSIRSDITESVRARRPIERSNVVLQRKDGSQFVADMRITVFTAGDDEHFVAAIIRDVTDRVDRERTLERTVRELSVAREKLVYSSRLAAIGELAAGVAHDINNPATYVLANIEDARERLAGGPIEREELGLLLDEAAEGVRRIAKTVEDLRTFARIDSAPSSGVDVNEVVRVATRMTANLLYHQAELHLDLGCVPLVAGHLSRLSQVIVTLLVNAMSRLDRAGVADKHIWVCTRHDADNVYIDVEDNFGGDLEPSRAGPEAGTAGYGLALTREIIEDYNGILEVVPGTRGSTFAVRLPVFSEEVSAPTHEPGPKCEQPSRLRVLVIDDDAAVRRVITRIVQKTCDVVTVGDGATALAELERVDANCAVVICDMRRPGQDGPAVYPAAVERDPRWATRFIFLTGGLFTESSQAFVSNINPVILAKPIDREKLLSLLAAWRI